LSGNPGVEAGSGSPVILVVEDELFVRLMAVDAIEDAGYCTIEAENADQALAVLEQRDDIAVLFSDIKMPGSIDGLGLAFAVRKRWPAMPIILTSGHLYRHDIEVPAAVPFLQKPYRAGELIAELDRVNR
jgi:CheY-like chemotaxis protein